MRATGIGLAVALLAASMGGAGAMDSHGGFRVKGVGTQTWWAGFVTAMNIMKPDTYDYIGGVAPEKVNGMLRQRCEAHPNELIAVAMYRVLEQLHPQRTRQKPNQ
jgi:hypothetical protein